MIKVLVVDDSIFMRTLVADMIDSDPEMKVVGTAKNGVEAVQKLSELKPDVVTLDMVMPGWDGLTTLKEIMTRVPTPVVLLSAYTKEGAELTLDCLDAGAVSFVLKPSGELSLDIQDIKNHLLQELRTASCVELNKIKTLTHPKRPKPRRRTLETRRILVIGASTGGPQTLEYILPLLPSDFDIPIIVVQHLPNDSFTRGLAEHLDCDCALGVKVPRSGEVLKGGTIYFAPSGFEMTLSPDHSGDKSKPTILVTLTKTNSILSSPSIDVTMESVAAIYQEGCMGLILTGMGTDGLAGMKAIKASGGQTIVQDESALIYGMPKAVRDAGAADKALPADKIAELLCGVMTCRKI